MEPLGSNDALISLLGFPGWGPLHLRLRRDGAPASLAGRLHSGLGVGSGRLPSLLLRRCPSAEPVLLRCGSWPNGLCRLRYRLLWRPGEAADVRITLWRREAGEGRWRCSWPTSRLEGFTSTWCGPQEPRCTPPADFLVSLRDARGLGLTPSSDWRP